MRVRGPDLARLFALAVPASLLAGAYVSEIFFGLYPCEMCWWQRYAHFAALVPASAALFVSSPELSTAMVRIAGAVILVAGLLGGFHAGVEYGWWDGVTQCATTGAATGDPLDAIMNAPIVRCDVAPWSLFGISLAGWNFLISGLAAMAIFTLSAPTARRGVDSA